ncbi:MAG: DNA-binding protein [Thermodesulfobacteriota bacterium]
MKKSVCLVLSGLALSMFVTGCGNGDKKEQASAPAPAPAQEAATAPAQSASPEQAAAQIVTGKVSETMDATGYTYMELDQGDKKVWVAMPQAKVNVGDEVSVIESMRMQNFESKTLNRKFDEVIFASGFAPGSAPAAAGETADASGSFSQAVQSAAGDMSTGGSGKAVVPFSELKVEKASGDNAVTVADIYAKKAELSGKPIALRGKVVKVSKNIMGKNWVHLQDGTGSPMDNTHDFVVTTSEVPEMDEVITVNGVLATDKDFGAGYVYGVIVEDATVAK